MFQVGDKVKINLKELYKNTPQGGMVGAYFTKNKDTIFVIGGIVPNEQFGVYLINSQYSVGVNEINYANINKRIEV